MQIDRRVGQLGVSEQQLNGAEIGTGFEQMRCEAMPQGVRRNSLGNPRSLRCLGHSNPGVLRWCAGTACDHETNGPDSRVRDRVQAARENDRSAWRTPPLHAGKTVRCSESSYDARARRASTGEDGSQEILLVTRTLTPAAASAVTNAASAAPAA